MRSFHSPAQQTLRPFSDSGKGPLFIRKKRDAKASLFHGHFRPPLRLLRRSFMWSSDSLLSELAINCLS